MEIRNRSIRRVLESLNGAEEEAKRDEEEPGIERMENHQKLGEKSIEECEPEIEKAFHQVFGGTKSRGSSEQTSIWDLHSESSKIAKTQIWDMTLGEQQDCIDRNMGPPL